MPGRPQSMREARAGGLRCPLLRLPPPGRRGPPRPAPARAARRPGGGWPARGASPAGSPPTPPRARRCCAEALAAGHEGVVVKAVSSPYEAGRRGKAWRKVKVARTLDLVVLGAEWGHGRRQGWLSNLHLGARRPRTGGFVMVGKTFKGMTDETLRLADGALPRAGDATGTGITVFVRPELVAEIALDGVQASTRYPGGVALRFARLKRYRDDKSPAEADTIDSSGPSCRRAEADDDVNVHTLTASEAAGLIRQGRLSPVALVEGALERIDDLDQQVRAWVCVDREGGPGQRRGTGGRGVGGPDPGGAARHPRRREGHLRRGRHGHHGGGGVVRPPAGHRGRHRRRSAAPRGCDHCWARPSPPRSPSSTRPLPATPGISGTRPAARRAARRRRWRPGWSRCPSAPRPSVRPSTSRVLRSRGLKPAFGTVGRGGMTPLAPSLDHVGIFCRSSADAALTLDVLAGRLTSPPSSQGDTGRPPRLGVARQLLAMAGPEVTGHLDAVATSLRSAGAVVEDVDLPPGHEGFFEAGLVVLKVEAAAIHAERFAARRGQYRPKIRELIEKGMQVAPADYHRAKEHLRRFQGEMAVLLGRVDAAARPDGRRAGARRAGVDREPRPVRGRHVHRVSGHRPALGPGRQRPAARRPTRGRHGEQTPRRGVLV